MRGRWFDRCMLCGMNGLGDGVSGQAAVYDLRYAGALAMADRHVIYKQCLKEIADQMGLSVTFMAKYASGGAGSSCHVHVSLWKDGKNAFAGAKKLGRIASSDVFRWFLGGWISHAQR